MSNKPLAPTSRPSKDKKEEPTTTEAKGPTASATVSKTSLVPVFVYGSLKQGFPLHAWLKDQTLVGNAVIEGHSLISLGAYPGLIRTGDPAHKVMGEYYLLSGDAYVQLKQMEERAGYATEVVTGTFSSSDKLPTLTDATFKAHAWVFGAISAGTAEWTSFNHQGDTFSFVDIIPEKSK